MKRNQLMEKVQKTRRTVVSNICSIPFKCKCSRPSARSTVFRVRVPEKEFVGRLEEFRGQGAGIAENSASDVKKADNRRRRNKTRDTEPEEAEQWKKWISTINDMIEQWQMC